MDGMRDGRLADSGSGIGRRACLLCGSFFGRTSFSTFQWGEGRLSKCIDCERGVPPAERSRMPRSQSSARRQSASARATVLNMHVPFESGLHRWMSFARYDDGTPAVAKWHRHARRSYADDGLAITLGERSAFITDLKVAQRALRLVDAWNAAGFIEVPVRVSVPELLRVRDGGPYDALGPISEYEGQHVLVEPFLACWTKFNSNSGWSLSREESAWGDFTLVMQALSHFTYHITAGEALLCNLKGGLEAEAPSDRASIGGSRGATASSTGRTDTAVPVLCDCALLTRARTFGPTDLGVDGMRNWFRSHKCNALCAGRGWLRPTDAEPLLAAERQTIYEPPSGLPVRATPSLGSGWRPAPPDGATGARAACAAAMELTSLGELGVAYALDDAAIATELRERTAAAQARAEVKARAVAAAAATKVQVAFRAVQATATKRVAQLASTADGPRPTVAEVGIRKEPLADMMASPWLDAAEPVRCFSLRDIVL